MSVLGPNYLNWQCNTHVKLYNAVDCGKLSQLKNNAYVLLLGYSVVFLLFNEHMAQGKFLAK